jgi:hypothetical protein
MPISASNQADDLRADRRRRTLFGAVIILDNRMSTFNATVRNRSGSGFLLDAANTVLIPDEFSLKLPEDPLEYRCVVVRRTSSQLGVKVIDRRTPSPQEGRRRKQVDQQVEIRAKLAARFPHLTKAKA